LALPKTIKFPKEKMCPQGNEAKEKSLVNNKVRIGFISITKKDSILKNTSM
jgi:hypothetical protein